MPVIGGNTPTVQVNVPVPTPAPMKKPRPQPQPSPQPVPANPESQQQAIPQGMVPPAPQQPEPRSIILPWAPPPSKPRQAMRKMRVKMARSTPESIAALEEQVKANPDDETLRHAWANEIEASGDKDRADVIRNGPRSIEVHGRRWFARTYGNTYHTAQLVVDGKQVPGVQRQYGYGDHYLTTAAEQLEKLGHMPHRQHHSWGGAEAIYQWARRYGVKFNYTIRDVPRQRDLHGFDQLVSQDESPNGRQLSRSKKYAAGDDLSMDFDSMGEDELPKVPPQRPLPQEDNTGRTRKQILQQMLDAAKKGHYDPAGMTPRDYVQDIEGGDDVPQGGGDVFMSDPEDELPEKMNRVSYPQRMARSTPESLDALFAAVQKSPDDQSLRHALAGELESVGHPQSVIANLRSELPVWIGKSPKGLINAIPVASKVALGAGVGYLHNFYHVTSRNRQGEAHRVRPSGKLQTWKTRPDDFRLPVKFGMYQSLDINPQNFREWLVEDPTQEPQ